MRNLFWFLFVTSVIWGTSLPGIDIPLLGTLYPLRIMIILLIVGSFFLKKNLIRNTGSAKITYIVWTLILFYGFLTIFWSIDQFRAVTYQIVYVTIFFVIIICIAFVKDKEHLIVISKSYLINTWIIGVLAIYESFSGNFIYEAGLRYLYTYNSLGLNTPVLFFYNINNLSTYMAISLPICYIACENMKFKRFNKLAILLLCSTVVFLIDSRAALIAIFIFLVLYLTYHFSDVIFQAEVWSIANAFDSDNIRVRIWTNTLLAAGDWFFIGFGPGNGYLANNMYQFIDTSDIFAIHNYFLEILIEFGIFGFVCFMIWFITLFLQLLKKRKVNSNNKYNNYLLLIFLFQYVILTVSASSITEMYFIWMIFGLCVASLSFPDELIKT